MVLRTFDEVRQTEIFGGCFVTASIKCKSFGEVTSHYRVHGLKDHVLPSVAADKAQSLFLHTHKENTRQKMRDKRRWSQREGTHQFRLEGHLLHVL